MLLSSGGLPLTRCTEAAQRVSARGVGPAASRRGGVLPPLSLGVLAPLAPRRHEASRAARLAQPEAFHQNQSPGCRARPVTGLGAGRACGIVAVTRLGRPRRLASGKCKPLRLAVSDARVGHERVGSMATSE